MADHDVTELLTNNLSGLQLFTFPAAEPALCRFDLFPNLPAELRLKVFTHALPIPTVLDIHGRIIIIDPSFGLYIAFSIPIFHSAKSNPGRSLTSVNQRRCPKQTRVLPLLCACRESRDAYLLEYDIALPYDHGPKTSFRTGTLYTSKRELLHWNKLDVIMRDQSFQRALERNYRLQDFWSQIESLALPIGCFVLDEQERGPCKNVLRVILAKMENLKFVQGVMWEGFQELPDNPGKSMMESSMRRYMGEVENALKDHELEVQKYRVPRFEIVF